VHPYLQWLLTLSRSRPRQAASRLNYSIVLVIGLIAVGTLATALIQGLDGWAITEVRRLPKEYMDFFEIVTDYGRSGWVIFPLLSALIALGVVSLYVRPGNPRLVVKSISARLWFLFLAIAVPGDDPAGITSLVIVGLFDQSALTSLQKKSVDYMGGADAFASTKAQKL